MQALTFCGSVLLLVTAALAADPTPAECPFADAPGSNFAVAKPIGDLASKLYKKIVAANPEKNVVYSPISIVLALALVESGAAGQTQTELKKILAPAGHNGDIGALYQKLQHQLRIKEDNAKLSVANGLFHSNDITLKADYLSKTQKCFETEIAKVNFLQIEAARQRINAWISNATAEKIPELIKSGALGTDTIAVLANAIYLKAAWPQQFFQTEDLKFNPNGRTNAQQTTKFMTRVGPFSYSSNEFVEMVEIPYDKVPISMYVVKAKTGALDANIESKFDQPDFFPKLMTSTTNRKLDLKWPAFTIRLPTALTEILIQLGVANMFTGGADFSRMVATNNIKVSSVVHEAFIKVNENGTEAAAATGVAMVTKMLIVEPSPEAPLPFIVDNPFAFTIVHKPTGTMLFHGKVNTIKNDVQ